MATASVAAPIMCGIYFLIREGRITYVGQSVNVIVRMASHASMTRQFDSWAWIPCDLANMSAVERAYINAFLPEDNTDSMTRRIRWERESEEREAARPRSTSVHKLPPWPELPAIMAKIEALEANEPEAERFSIGEHMRQLRAMRTRR